MKFITKTFLVVAAVLSTQASAITSGRNILISFDGTGQSPRVSWEKKKERKVAQFTNVLKLHLLAGGSIDKTIKEEKFPNQICLYEEGVGTRSDNKYVNILKEGIGLLSRQTVPMKKRLEEIYQDGDKLYITGFSRGAASARRFVVDLQKKGLCTASGKRVKDVEVELLACYDTVSDQTLKALNPFIRFSFYHRFFNLAYQSATVLGEKGGKLPTIVKKAVHYVSLDDKRAGTFSPVLMDSEDKDDRVTEVWYPGCHSDVGGGYPEAGLEMGAGVSMKKEMERAGLKFMPPSRVDAESLKISGSKNADFGPEDLSLAPNPSDIGHEKIYVKARDRPIRSVTNDKPIQNGPVYVHVSLLKRLQSKEPMTLKSIVGRKKDQSAPYVINSYLAEANFKVVGDDGRVLNSQTQGLKEIVKAWRRNR